MIDAVIRWSLANRLFVVVGAMALLAWGSVETSRTPVDVFPDLTAPTVTLVADAHGMAAEEVEVLLTVPIESALNGASGVRRIRSQTTVGFAVIYVDFVWGTDIMRARQVVSERLAVFNATLPPGIEPPVMGPITSIMGDILFIGLTSDRHSDMELRTVAQWTLARRLLAVTGVAQALTLGGDERQFQVLLDPRRLDAYELTADDVAHALEEASENTSAGFLVEGGQENLIHGLGRVRSPEDIAQSLVTMRGDMPITVGDLASVEIGPPPVQRGSAGVNGRSAVLIGVRKQPSANTLDLTRRIEETLAVLDKTLPEGIELHTSLFRQADFIQIAVDNVSEALRDGALLVIVIVLLFLLNPQATIITALAIPLSLLAAILAMRLQDIEINTMTLGGMAIAVGALVDDAIIDVENVTRRLRLNAARPPGQRRRTLAVVFDASKEIRRSIVFATLIIALVFVPLFFLSGVEGRLLQPLGFAYVVSLFASLIVALTVTPVLCSMMLPAAKAVRVGRESVTVSALKGFYRPILDLLVGRWKLLTLASLLALAGAAVALGGAGRAFLPSFNEGSLTLSVVTLPGTALEESTRLAAMVEEILLSHPEVVATSRRTGRAEGDEHSQPVNASEVDARLRMTERGEAAFLAALRDDLDTVPGTNVVIGQPIEHRIDHMLSGTRANIAVKVFGPHLPTLRRLAEQARAVMSEVDGAVDVAIEQQADVPFVRVRFRRDAIARHGLTVQAVAHEIETAFSGRTVGRVLEEQASFDLVVRYGIGAIDTLEAVREARIGTPTGARLPLHVLADVVRDVGPNLISREDVERKAVVMANVAGRDLQAVASEIREAVDGALTLPEGYRVVHAGQVESASKASRTLLLVGALVILGTFLLLFVALGSVRDAALVMANLPFALIGGVAGVYVSGGVVSVAAIIGFISLFGIATRNGIMMVTHFHHLLDSEGVTDPVAIVRRGAMERLSPILMTALASGLGLLPLALATGEPGSEIQAPMAIVILCGLVSSTVLNMVVLPALYLRFGAVTRYRVPRSAPAEAPAVS